MGKSQCEAILVLENGSIYRGVSVGAVGKTVGELCFNTGMTGYQEVFTDPSYHGQIILMTNPHIGNYGISSHEMESDSPKISGMICKNFSSNHFRSVADGDLQSFLESHNIVCISNIDTRTLVREIRNQGAMNALIVSDGSDIDDCFDILRKSPSMSGLELSSRVCTDKVYTLGDENSAYRIAVYDFGIKKSILKNFVDRGCYLKVFPAKTSFEEVAEFQAHGYFLSNGPGDPAAMDYAIKTTKKILESGKPLFGICLGHQILALALNISTYKMHHGHRGLNHPVKNLLNGRSEITSQNHGFAVSPDEVEHRRDIILTHINLNDNSVEGIKSAEYPAFSVQYHPEASPGPHDANYIFDEFLELIK